MIQLAEGNLLDAHVEALVNTVNTVGVMGKGIALQFKQAYPENFKAYARACDEGELKLGRMFVFDTGRLEPRYIINFPTKKHWRAKSRLRDVESGLQDLREVIQELGIKSIAVPPLGCGNGGLSWADVRPRIEDALSDIPGLDVRLFAPTGAPEPAEMPIATKRPSMTAGRAALIGLMRRYSSAGAVATPLALQKLMYLLQEAGEPLRLRFERGHYGPYAENLNHVLQAVEGHFLRGYGDRSRSVAEEAPIELLPGASEEAEVFLAEHPETLERFAKVDELIQGFESRYGLELLSTVHWIASKEDPLAVDDSAKAVKAVQAWNRRKAHLFEQRHIHLAWERLRNQGWLSRTPAQV